MFVCLVFSISSTHALFLATAFHRGITNAAVAVLLDWSRNGLRGWRDHVQLPRTGCVVRKKNCHFRFRKKRKEGNYYSWSVSPRNLTNFFTIRITRERYINFLFERCELVSWQREQSKDRVRILFLNFRLRRSFLSGIELRWSCYLWCTRKWQLPVRFFSTHKLASTVFTRQNCLSLKICGPTKHGFKTW
jgi:hypothetical protein